MKALSYTMTALMAALLIFGLAETAQATDSGLNQQDNFGSAFANQGDPAFGDMNEAAKAVSAIAPAAGETSDLDMMDADPAMADETTGGTTSDIMENIDVDISHEVAPVKIPAPVIE